MIRIGIDIASGEVPASDLFLALKEYSLQNLTKKLVVFVDEESIQKNPDIFKSSDNIELVHASQTISMKDNPIKSLKRKKDSSIVLGLDCLKKNNIDFFFSPGNTGAVVYGAYQILGMIRNLHFPAIAVMIPNIHGDVVLLDTGASASIDEDRALELAVMGKFLYKNYFNEDQPELGILNLGKEWHKGPKWVRKLNKILSKQKSFNYKGYVEGFDVLTSKCRVFITGGYTGNVLIKGFEGMYTYLTKVLQTQEKSSSLIKKAIHYSRTGAGIVLGVKKPVFIGHGITSPEALKNALIFAEEIYKLNMEKKIEAEIKHRSFILKLLTRRRR